MRTDRKKWIFLFGVGAAVILAAALSLFYGGTRIPAGQVLQALENPELTNHQHLVVLELRIPRTIGCILVGAAFGTAGAIMQGVTGNPLADSGLLGINAGAVFALALCLAFWPGLNFSGVVLFSFLGAAGAMAVVYGMMFLKKRRLNPVHLVLAGSGGSIFLSSLSQAIAIFYNIGYDLTFWTAGGAAGIRGKQLVFAAPVLVLGLALGLVLSGKISVLSLGEEAARGLGISVEKTRAFSLLAVLLLAGGAVALAGPIAFVGLLVPHIARHFLGGDYRFVIPGSLILGAFFMVIADVLSRVIHAPGETPVGLVFAAVGVPFFLWIVRKEERAID